MRIINSLLAASLALASACVGAIELGSAAPAFSLQPLSAGPPIGIADMKGKVVLVDFWASWCSPCRQSLPLYDKLRADFPRADFEILAISLDEEAADAKEFLTQHAVSYPTLHNPQGDVAKAFGLIGMPSSYLIDRAGVVRARHTGFEPKDIEALRSEITGLIGTQTHAQ